MEQLLSGVVEYGTASSVKLKEIVDTAGKTGTSGGSKDKVFVGFTPYYTAGIWCGYDNGKSVVSGSGHLKLWDDIMRDIHKTKLSTEDSIKGFKTDGLVYSAYCRDSGKLYSPECILDERGDRMGYGYFIMGTEPAHNCDVHVVVRVDEFTGEVLFPYDIRYQYGLKTALLNIEKRALPPDVTVADEKYILENKVEDFAYDRKKIKRFLIYKSQIL